MLDPPDGRRMSGWRMRRRAEELHRGRCVRPRKPKVVCQTDSADQAYMRSRTRWRSAGIWWRSPIGAQKKVAAAGWLGAVRHLQPGDRSSISFVRLLGSRFSRGVHRLWFCRRRIRPHGVRARRTSCRTHRTTQATIAALTCATVVEAGEEVGPLAACRAPSKGDNEGASRRTRRTPAARQRATAARTTSAARLSPSARTGC